MSDTYEFLRARLALMIPLSSPAPTARVSNLETTAPVESVIHKDDN